MQILSMNTLEQLTWKMEQKILLKDFSSITEI